MVVEDWAEGVLAIDLVDSLLYPLLYNRLDDVALTGGAGAYSLFTQHLWTWFADQRKWLDALVAVWAADPGHSEENQAILARIVATWAGRAQEAVGALASVIDAQVLDADSSTSLNEITQTRAAYWAKVTGGAV